MGVHCSCWVWVTITTSQNISNQGKPLQCGGEWLLGELSHHEKAKDQNRMDWRACMDNDIVDNDFCWQYLLTLLFEQKRILKTELQRSYWLGETSSRRRGKWTEGEVLKSYKINTNDPNPPRYHRPLPSAKLYPNQSARLKLAWYCWIRLGLLAKE